MCVSVKTVAKQGPVKHSIALNTYIYSSASIASMPTQPPLMPQFGVRICRQRAILSINLSQFPVLKPHGFRCSIRQLGFYYVFKILSFEESHHDPRSCRHSYLQQMCKSLTLTTGMFLSLFLPYLQQINIIWPLMKLQQYLYVSFIVKFRNSYSTTNIVHFVI